MLDTLWILICTAMVFTMQAGFTCLESGMVRNKNSINVATKNMVDFLVAAFIFWACGYALINGSSLGGWIGQGEFFFANHSNPQQTSIFLYQLMFCGTAVTIVSGAVAERIAFRAYLILAVIMSLLIYPLFAHWVWGGQSTDSQGWLAASGYIDFAGASVVHAVGGLFALAAVIIIGPRIGRFDSPQDTPIPNSSLPIATLGVFLIWFGWIGFNGGSTLSLSDNVPGIIMNTMLAGVSGGLSLVLVLLMRHKPINVIHILNGVLTGLVSITAAAHLVSPHAAVVMGAIGGLLYFSAYRLLIHYRIDDVVGAFPVHGIGGIWGVIAVALFGNGVEMMSQLSIQLLGLGVLLLWAFGVSYGLLWLINHRYPLRVPRLAELDGLNISEHGANTAQSNLIMEMERQRRSGNFSTQVSIDMNSDIGRITAQYNLVVEKMNLAIGSARIANKVKTTFLHSISHEYRTPLNHIIGFAELLQMRDNPLDQDEQTYLAHIIDSGKQLLELLDNILEFTEITSDEQPVKLSVVNLNELILKNLSIYQDMLDEQQIQVDNTITNMNLPTLISDPKRLDHILHQLIHNAVVYNRMSGLISIRCQQRADNRIRISIQDSGIGIPLARYQDVFEPLNRLGQESGLVPGAGVGLPIAQVLLDSLGGHIGFDSEVGKGSTFWFDLPLLDISVLPLSD